MKPRTQPGSTPFRKKLMTLICVAQVLALFLTGIVAARPNLSSEKPTLERTVAPTAEEIAAGVGDTSPTDDAATSDPISETDSHGWWTAQLSTQETIRSIRYILPEISLSRTDAYLGYSQLIFVYSTLGEVSAELPYRFALVGQRPSGTS